MVRAATSFGRSGVSDWIIQRFSAVILTAYTLFIVVFLVLNPGLDYATWHGLFSNTAVRIFTLLALLSVAAHGWIGLWAVITDYLTERVMGSKALPLRMFI
ncbi:MAG: succinate dehydrogenase, hydrophobic membrane anchor protein [Chryseobacterium sp.]|nr:MAG: succinate dehydrogenase, hydrophobic membrane anchor protein [Chryseobacterium sp.]